MHGTVFLPILATIQTDKDRIIIGMIGHLLVLKYRL